MALFQNISLQQLYRGAAATFLRYPLVLLAAFTGTIAAVFRIELSYQNLSLHPYLDKLILVSALGLILFFVLELVACKYKFNLAGRVLLWAAGLVLLAVYFVLLPRHVDERQLLRFLMLALALHLAASYAMFANLRQENAFWQFNKSLFLRILTSALYAAVLYVGLVVAVAAIDKLFLVNVPDNFYAQLWVCMVGIFNTWFFLAGVPTNVSELEERQSYPTGLKVFTQFVLLPLVTLYLLILYLYFGKIVLQWAWPQGWVSVLVLCFSIAGILSLLLVHPIRLEPGHSWMRTFARWFYRALFPLIILLLLAIWRRVSEYGITEPRYVVLVLALWLFCTALYFLLSRRKNIKFIPVTLSVVAVLAAFGPFNAFQVSAWSQTNRLKDLLQQSGVLQNGQVQTKHPGVKKEVAQEVSSIARYLARMHDLRNLQPWFKQDLDVLLKPPADSIWNHWSYADEQAKAVVELMGISYGQAYGNLERIATYRLAQPGAQVLQLQGYDYLLTYNQVFSVKATQSIDNAAHAYQLSQAGVVTVQYDSAAQALRFNLTGDSLLLPLHSFYADLQQQGAEEVAEQSMTRQLDGSKLRIKIVFRQVTLRSIHGAVLPDEINADILVAVKQ